LPKVYRSIPEILVVDDQREIREVLTRSLTNEGYHVTSAIDGQDGLDALSRGTPDLILLDLAMPRVNGYQVLEFLKSSNEFQAIPVIILTALNNQSQIIRGLQQGANDYIAKPFNMEELLARVRVQVRILDLEQQLRESEAYHRALFERTSDPEMVIDKSGSILQVNEAATDLLAVSQDQLLNRPIHELVDPSDLPEFEVAFTGSFEGSEIPIFEIHLCLSEEKILPVDVDLSSVDIRGERHLLLHLRDIRRRKSAEAQSSMIFEHIGDGVFITDSKGIILLASRSGSILTGYPRDEIVGLDIAQFQTREGAIKWQEYIEKQNSEAAVYEDHFVHRSTGETPVEWTLAAFTVGSEIYFIGVVHDLTDRLTIDRERRESERLQTLLEIAGGAAHEINQPLTAILGYAEMALSLLDGGHPSSAYQESIIEATARISNILKQMQEVREYRTRPYTSGHRIVDFAQSSEEQENGET